MAGDEKGDQSLAHTVELLYRPFRAALADAAPSREADRPWPPGMRWVRRLTGGGWPFSAFLQFVDLLIAVIIYFGTYSTLYNEVSQHGLNVWSPLLMLAAFLAALPVALRERHPMAAWRVLVVGILLVAPTNWLDVQIAPGAAVAGVLVLYTVAARCSLELTLGVALWSVIGSLLIDRSSGAGPAFVALLPLVAGYAVQLRRNARRALAEQEEAARRELAEQERRHLQAQAVLTERQRIARELHDVVAHHMSMIAIQAEAAPYKVEALPDETRGDLAEIRSTALDALTEMRRVLGVLRSEDGAATAPQPGLDRIDELVTGARATGLRVRIERRGDLTRVPPGIGLTAYRILQEALSNAMRHAPGSKVDIDIVRTGGTLLLEVVNGPPAAGRPASTVPGDGHGLVGMRERATMLGGTLAAEPTPGGGFAISATLPEAGGT